MPTYSSCSRPSYADQVCDYERPHAETSKAESVHSSNKLHKFLHAVTENNAELFSTLCCSLSCLLSCFTASGKSVAAQPHDIVADCGSTIDGLPTALQVHEVGRD